MQHHLKIRYSLNEKTIGNKMLYFANNQWDPTKKNPFSSDGNYGDNWSAFIYDKAGQYILNANASKLHTVYVDQRSDYGMYRLNDFVKYETDYKRQTILKIGRLRKLLYKSICSTKDSALVRSSDPRWLIHSTTERCWEKIKQSGFLLSPQKQNDSCFPANVIGINVLNEPTDYASYIMLDVLDGSSETVVSSRQLGYICLRNDVSYTPGARLYFDAHKIIQDGLGVRDGLHILKVKDELLLEKYCAAVIEPRHFQTTQWTPITFTTAANKLFFNMQKGITVSSGINQN